MTERQVREALPPLSRLNSFARAEIPYEARSLMTDCNSAIYAMKQRLIRETIDMGMAAYRLVSVVRSCKTCHGTGTYEWHSWHDDYVDYQACRRCAGSPGKVTLRFIETDILGYRWHTPRPKADFLAHLKLDWEKCEPTDWEPEQPGTPMSGRELNTTLNEAERALFGDKLLRWHNGWRGSVYDYSLHFGAVTECFVCGRNPARRREGFNWPNRQAIYKPGLKWEQHICPQCEEKADRWPRQWPASLWPKMTRGQWVSESPAWPMNVPFPAEAQSEVTQEWLARRGIRIGMPVPSDYCYLACYLAGSDDFVDLVAIKGDDAYVKITDWKHWAFLDHDSNSGFLRVPASLLRARLPKLLEAGSFCSDCPPIGHGGCRCAPCPRRFYPQLCRPPQEEHG